MADDSYYWKVLKPEYDRRKAIVKQGVSALAVYGATLAVNGQDERLAWLRVLIKYMVMYWYPDKSIAEYDEATGKFEETDKECLRAFEQTISTAQAVGEARELNDAEKQAVIDGLAVHIRTLREDDPIPGIVEYEKLYTELQSAWVVQEPHMGGQTFG